MYSVSTQIYKVAHYISISAKINSCPVAMLYNGALACQILSLLFQMFHQKCIRCFTGWLTSSRLFWVSGKRIQTVRIESSRQHIMTKRKEDQHV